MNLSSERLMMRSMRKLSIGTAMLATLGGGGMLVTNAVGGATEAAATEMAAATIEVNRAERRLVLRAGGEVVGSWPVAVGKEGHRTPAGSYSIRRIIWNPWWRPPNSKWARGKKATPPGHPNNPMGQVKIFFREPTYYIHGTPDASSVGRAISHGCIRMHNNDAVELAKLLMRYGGSKRGSSWVQQVLNRGAETEVRLPNAIPVRIR